MSYGKSSRGSKRGNNESKRGRGGSRGRGSQSRGGSHSNTQRSTKYMNDGFDLDQDSDFTFGMGSTNVNVSYKPPRKNYQDRWGNDSSQQGYNDNYLSRSQRNAGLGYGSNFNSKSKMAQNKKNQNSRNLPYGNNRVYDFEMTKPDDPNMPQPYSKSRSPFVVPITFVKSTVPYDPSAEINAYLESRKKRAAEAIDKEVTDSESSLQKLKLNDVEIMVTDGKDQASIKESQSEEDQENEDDDDSSDDDLENMLKFASSDIGGDGEGMSYHFDIPSDSNENDTTNTDKDGEKESFKKYLVMRAEDEEEIKDIEDKYFECFLILKDTDSENHWNRLYGAVSDDHQKVLPFSLFHKGTQIKCQYDELATRLGEKACPSFPVLVNMIRTKGRYHSLLDDLKNYELFKPFENTEAYLKSTVNDKISELASAEEDTKYQSNTTEEQSLQTLISQMSDIQDSKKKSKTARRLERERYEEMEKGIDPSYNASKPKRNNKPDFSKADPLFRDDLESQFETARKNQALKKMERKLQRDLAKSETRTRLRGEKTVKEEEINREITDQLLEKRKEMLVAKKGYVNLTYKYPVFMTCLDVFWEIENFITNMSRKSLPFPQMTPEDIELIRSVATGHYKLETKLKGGEVDPHLTLIKTDSSSLRDLMYDDHYGIYFSLMNFAGQRLWNLSSKVNPNLLTPKMVHKLKYRNLMIRNNIDLPQISQSSKKNKRLQDGHVVGSNAKEIPADNVGHQILMKLGWTKGTGLGSERSGISEPLVATFKGSKLGLGNMG